MPFLSAGRYEVVLKQEGLKRQELVRSSSSYLPVQEELKSRELAGSSFFYFPTANYFFLLGCVAGAGVMGLHVMKVRRASPAWWLMAPVMVGMVAVMVDVDEGIGVIGLMECLSLAAWLGMLAIVRGKRRWLMLGLGFAMTTIMTTFLLALFAQSRVTDIGDVMELGTVGTILSAYWFVPMAISVLLLRGRFSVKRLIGRMAVMWVIETMTLGGLFIMQAGLHDVVVIMATVFVLPLPYLIGLTLFIGLGRWYRSRFMAALRLAEVSGEGPGGEGSPSGLSQTPSGDTIEVCRWPRL
jgi:hypothetical protein